MEAEETAFTSSHNGGSRVCSTVGAWFTSPWVLKKDGCVRGGRLPVMLSLCYEKLRSFYTGISTDSSMAKTQLSQKFVADSPAPYPGFFLCVAVVTLLRDPFSAGSSGCGCRLSCGWGEPQARGRNCWPRAQRSQVLPGTRGPARSCQLQTLLHLDCEGVKAQDFFVWDCSLEAPAWAVILLLHRD